MWNTSDSRNGHSSSALFATDDSFFVFLHVLFASMYFLPFFIFNHVFLANTDVTDCDAPMLIHQISNLITGTIAQWNPFQMSGVPEAFYSIGHAYSLDNLLLALVPVSYLFIVVTFMTFVRLSLIGVIAYYLFKSELRSSKWAFFGSLTYQFCLYTFWQMSYFDAFSFWLYLTLALYLLWTMPQRGLFWNFILLLIVMVQLLLPSHIVMGIYAFGLIILMFCYLFCAHDEFNYGHLGSCLGALAGATLLFSIRVFPLWEFFGESTRVVSLSLHPINLSMFGLRLIIPEFLGFNFRNYPELITSLSPVLSGIHLHWFFPHFLGVLTFLLAFCSLFAKKTPRMLFWIIVSLLIIAVNLNIEPADMIFRAVGGTLAHPLGLALLVPFPMCMLAAMTGQRIQCGALQHLSDRVTICLLALVAAVGVSFLTIWTYHIVRFYPWFQFVYQGTIFILGGLVFVLAVIVARSPWLVSRIAQTWSRFSELAVKRLGTSFAVLSVGAIVVLCCRMLPHADRMTQTMVYCGSSILLGMLAMSICLILMGSDTYRRTYRSRAALCGAAILLLISIFVWEADEYFPADQLSNVGVIAFVGLMRFALISLAFVFLLRNFGLGKLSGNVFFVILIIIQIFDVLPAFKVHSHISTRPFFEYSAIFPGRSMLFRHDGDETVNVQDYRINRPCAFLALPYQIISGHTGGLNASFQVYGIRSTGGCVNAYAARYSKLCAYFGEKQGFHTRVLTSSRLLDLLAVGYDATAPGRLSKRPRALSRVMFFDSVIVTEHDDDILALLKSPQFDPLESVVLKSEPHNGSREVPGARGVVLHYQEPTPDRIDISVTAERPGIVLFNDNYSKGWRAFVNGRTVFPIISANYYAMAVPVPAGQSKVVFQFEPRGWTLGVGMFWAGTGLVVALAIFFLFLDRKSRKLQRGSASLGSRLRGCLSEHRTSFIYTFVLAALVLVQASFNYKDSPTPDYKYPTSIISSSVHKNFGADNVAVDPDAIWHAESPPKYPEWRRIRFLEPFQMKSISIRTQPGHFGRGPREFDPEGSMAGETWNTLLRVRNACASCTRGDWRERAVTSAGKFLYHRLLIKANCAETDYLTIAGLRFR